MVSCNEDIRARTTIIALEMTFVDSEEIFLAPEKTFGSRKKRSIYTHFARRAFPAIRHLPPLRQGSFA